MPRPVVAVLSRFERAKHFYSLQELRIVHVSSFVF